MNQNFNYCTLYFMEIIRNS